MSPREKQGVKSPQAHRFDAIALGVTTVLTHEDLWSQILDSSGASLPRNDIGRFEIVTENPLDYYYRRSRKSGGAGLVTQPPP